MNENTSKSETPGVTGGRLNYALGPLAAGMILDCVDVLTFGPVGLFLGIPVGAAAGYWLASSLRLSKNLRAICAMLGAVYCSIPGTEVIPLGTLLGALVRFEEGTPVSANERSDATGSPHVIDVGTEDTDSFRPGQQQN